MKLYLIRHGETDFNLEGRATGLSDVPLNKTGIQQVEAIVPMLPVEAEAIYCSDLTRTKQTAEILNSKLNLPLYFSPLLNERDFGALSGKSWNEIGEDMKTIDREMKYDYRPYAGESVEDVTKRIEDFIVSLKSGSQPYQNIIVVTSSGVIRLWYYLINHYLPKNTQELKREFTNGSIHEFII